MKLIRAFLVIALSALTFPAYAADSGASSTTAPAKAAPAPQDPATLDKRLELAKKMHEIRPTRDQVYSAIDQVAAGQPASEREAFKQAMRSILNYKAIEKISIDAMAEIYTPAELQAMVDYFSKPEAASAVAKDAEYGERVYPEIVRMLDQAMMRVRTGGDNSAPSPGATADPPPLGR